MFHILVELVFLIVTVFFCYVTAIRNGEPVVHKGKGRDEFPYMAGLQYKTQFWCGAVLVTPDAVLTAAHCIKKDYMKSITVRVGGNSAVGLSSEIDPVQINKVRSYQVHPNYQKKSKYDYDIALIWVSKKFQIGPKVKPISMTNSKSDFQSERVSFLGWGQTENGVYSDVLLKTKFIVVPHQACADLYKKKFIFTDRMICAWESNTKIRTAAPCEGDSGGPLVIHNPGHPEKDRLIGIASVSQEYSKKCTGYIPAIFTHVGSISKWALELLVINV